MKFLKYLGIGTFGFFIGRGFQIALDYPVLNDYAEMVANSFLNKRR